MKVNHWVFHVGSEIDVLESEDKIKAWFHHSHTTCPLSVIYVNKHWILSSYRNARRPSKNVIYYYFGDIHIARIHAHMRTFFFLCNKYILQREYLHRRILGYAPFTLATILFGAKSCTVESYRKIVKLVHQYIRESRRFLSG